MMSIHFKFTQCLSVKLKMSICAILHICDSFDIVDIFNFINKSVKLRNGLRSKYHFDENETEINGKNNEIAYSSEINELNLGTEIGRSYYF